MLRTGKLPLGDLQVNSVVMITDHLDMTIAVNSRSKAKSNPVCASFQGVLLYGPPGTGKTLLARAVAHHTECTFIRVSGSELVQKFIGEGSRMVRELFVMARFVIAFFVWINHFKDLLNECSKNVYSYILNQ